MNDENTLSLSVEKEINANIERVFDAWLDPVTLSQFMLPKPGMPNPAVTIDAKQGGRFSIDMDVGDNIIPHSGTYLEIDRPNKIVFTWESPFSVEGSEVTLLFTPLNEHKTKIQLDQVRFLTEESRDSHNGGWTNILTAMDDVV